ncbi:MAG: hypothetical protein KF729_04960 [Sandaracinaceae bacterium]|nr:hypothetical protein [Sandaracinaceae bacterium]
MRPHHLRALLALRVSAALALAPAAASAQDGEAARVAYAADTPRAPSPLAAARPGPRAPRTDEAAAAGQPASPAPAEAPSTVRVVAHQRLIALLNPMGAEHRFDLSVRAPLGDQRDLFFDGAHLQGGATSFVSPVYAIGGGFVELAPFSFLVLRGEVMGAGVWPIGMNAAGHYGLTSYDDDVRGEALPGAQGGSARGLFAGGSVTLQGAIGLGDGVRLLFASELGLTYVALGDAPYYYSMKHDLVLAREDLVLTNSAFLGLEVRCASDLLLRVGAYDDVRHVPASGYVGHQLGPIAMLSWERIDPALSGLTIFVRGGGYTHHVFRAGEATILGGVALDYDLGGL